ncbi:hypothetical protein JCM14244_09280 [Venenivibrio stagnispumantis]|uniref:C-di-GMP-binding flagellar brake protein YcgR, contains PilZNR and PilZ domains n=1 Tax=Venenivibrio stagnispumantis TaxID=407998 RepID=A0AA45WP88_9AQUI|nr:PilZ domain-containing protein [Venenivibrio stagnispumantis]MCW4573375.1 PilZ domain-containing protein [Venenivibrio stagnispumantis]SMP20867.1 c-di-GMP-binding flagellar brake protein YcgR, contains PilZNR and PilZ domains [Venenivibrio stagnispumantis]
MEEKQKSVIEAYKTATQKLEQTNVEGILFLIFLILLIIILIFATTYLTKKLNEVRKKSKFIKYLKEKHLSDEQIDILWDYSLKLGRDPFLSVEFKAPFEKVIDLYEKENPNFNEELIQDLRKKLNFDTIPNFIPLNTTKEIEIFQGGKLVTQDLKNFNVALYDKNERYMYWVVLDPIANIKKGDTVKITFIRKNDGIYNFEGVVEDIEKQGDRIIIKLPHTFDLERHQRREYPRFEIELDALLGIPKKEENKEIIGWISGKIMDVSPGGVKFCITEENKERIPLKTEVYIKFELENREILEKAEIVNIFEKEDILCYGVKFTQIKEAKQKFIFDFITKKQTQLRQLLKEENE